MLGQKMRKALLALAATAGLFAAQTAGAEPLPAPVEKPILTISGHITESNREGVAQFDRPMLESLGMQTVETKTPWYEGKVKFEGVSLDGLMKRVGASGENVTIIALNDYSTEIPMEDFAKHKAILALKRNGEYMPVRDKGPLFIVYPYDSNPELQTHTYYARSAWQVAKIIVR